MFAFLVCLLSQCIRDIGAPRSHRTGMTSGSIDSGLMFEFGIQRCAKDQNDDGEPRPHQKAYERTQGTIGGAVVGKAVEVESEPKDIVNQPTAVKAAPHVTQRTRAGSRLGPNR